MRRSRRQNFFSLELCSPAFSTTSPSGKPTNQQLHCDVTSSTIRAMYLIVCLLQLMSCFYLESSFTVISLQSNYMSSMVADYVDSSRAVRTDRQSINNHWMCVMNSITDLPPYFRYISIKYVVRRNINVLISNNCTEFVNCKYVLAENTATQ